MEQRPTTAEIARAEYFRQYCCGFAYIPLQDLPIYREAFDKVISWRKELIK